MPNSNLRRMMMARKPSSTSGDWDIDWVYTDGPLESLGFSVSGHTEMRPDGLHLFSDKTARITRIECPITTCKRGIAEALVVFTSLPFLRDRYNGFRYLLSNGDTGCQFRCGQSRNLVEPTFQYNEGDKYIDISTDPISEKEYLIRMEYIANAENIIFIDNKESLRSSLPSTYYCSGNKIFQQDAGETILKALRYKFIER